VRSHRSPARIRLSGRQAGVWIGRLGVSSVYAYRAMRSCSSRIGTRAAKSVRPIRVASLPLLCYKISTANDQGSPNHQPAGQASFGNS
jgi:hypothetical protein